MSRVTADTTLLRQSVSQTLVDALKGLLMLVAVVVAMVLLDAVLLLVTVAVLAVAASLGGAILGGLAGMRFHRKVDRTGLGA